MKNLSLRLFVAGCILLSLRAPAWAGANLPFGQTQTGTIAAAAQTNRYTFTANTGDIIYLTMTKTSGSLSPKFSVLTSTGTVDGSAFGNNGYGNCGGSVAELNTVTLTVSTGGTYTVIVGDCSNTNTGDYAIYAQRINNPSEILNAPTGEATAGTIALAAQNDTYTFNGTASDNVDFVMTASGGLSPLIQLYSPAGIEIGHAFGNNGYGNCGGDTAELYQASLPVTGTYTILIGDCSQTHTGGYDFFLQSMGTPAGGIDLLWDQTQASTISLPAWNDTYTFSGTANDTIDITMTRTSNNLSPRIVLYNSDTGVQVSSAFGNNGYGNCGGSTLTDNVVLPATASYTLLVRDCSNLNTGKYNISAQCFGTCLLPAPTLASLSSTSALAGSGGFTLTVNGTDFVNNESNSVVQWNGSPLTTTWVSLIQMTAVVPATDTATAGIFPVTVFTPTPGGGTSAAINFTVNNPVPTTTSPLSPASVTALGPAFTLTVTGTNFVPSSQVMWNGASLAIVSQTATQLQATVPASDCTVGGTATVTVFNPTPGGGTSNAQTFTCNNPMPAITLPLVPASAIAGGPAFTLTLNGSNFVTTSTVNWNGSGLPTAYVSSTQLTAQVPAADIASPGTASVTVFNPTPGGGTSSPATFTINPAPAILASPASGSTLPCSSATFSWAASTGVTNYWLNIGTGTGGAAAKNLYSSGPTTATSLTVTTLPSYGQTIYATLNSYILGAWQAVAPVTYTECGTPVLAAITSPTPGSQLPSSSVTFTWSAGGGLSGYWLDLGTAPNGANAKNLYSSGPTSATTVTVNGLPTNGETIYATLYSDSNGTWLPPIAVITYYASGPAVLTSPSPTSEITASTTFNWTPGTGISKYWFNLGTGDAGANAKNIYSGSPTTALTETVTGIPQFGETLYATLYSYISGAWQPIVYTYKAGGSPVAATLTTPTPSTKLTSSSVTFTWSAGEGVTYYWFNLGTTDSGANAKNLYSGSSTTLTSVNVTGLPTNGETIYATLYSYIAGAWQPTVYTYTASGTPSPAVLTIPSPTTQLTSSTVTFTWSAGNPATSYWFSLGTASSGANAKNIYSSGSTTATSATVSGLPTNGETIYATLYSYIDGAWQPTVYTYTAQ